MPEPNLVHVVEDNLRLFVAAAQRALGDQLRSITLYGSAALAQQRPMSDVNVILVLRSLDLARLCALREPLRTAHATIRLEAMLVCESELPEVIEAFADKFADIARRRRVLYGDDVFAQLAPSRRAQIARLQQVLLNQELRLRQRYLLTSLREEQATAAIAQAAGPMRALAATLRSLEGKAQLAPKEALVACAREQDAASADWLALVSSAREGRALPPGEASEVLRKLLALAAFIRQRARALRQVPP